MIYGLLAIFLSIVISALDGDDEASAIVKFIVIIAVIISIITKII